jgi:hypothetical protein
VAAAFPPSHRARWIAGLLAAVMVASGGAAAGAASPSGTTPPSAPAPPASNGELLFLRSTAEGRALYRVGPDGHDRRELLRVEGDWYRNQPLDVSPDGRRLLWLAREPVAGSLALRSSLQVSNVDGSRRTTLRDLGEHVDLDSASWSADGLSIVYLAENRLHVVDADGRNERRLAVPAGHLSSVHWSPAGDRIALIADDRANDPEFGPRVWVLDAADGGGRRVVPTTGTGADRNWEPTEVRWAPDGRQLGVLIEDIEALDCTFRAVRTVNADGTGLRTVPVDPPFDCHVRRLTFSPDGAQFAVHASGPEGATYLHRFPVAGGQRTQVTGPREGAADQLATWRPIPDLLAAACPTGRVPSAGFPDTTGHAHRRGIDCVAWWEVTEGRSDGSYGPDATVTRGQMASFVARALEAAGRELPPPVEPRFDDLAGSVHAERIEQLAEAGIVQGVGGRSFAPDRAVTRAQMAAYLARSEAWRTGHELPSVPDAFADDDGHALQRQIDQVAAVGLTTGIDGTRFGPGASVTRGQMATFLSRLLDRAVRDGAAAPPAR